MASVELTGSGVSRQDVDVFSRVKRQMMLIFLELASRVMPSVEQRGELIFDILCRADGQGNICIKSDLQYNVYGQAYL